MFSIFGFTPCFPLGEEAKGRYEQFSKYNEQKSINDFVTMGIEVKKKINQSLMRYGIKSPYPSFNCRAILEGMLFGAGCAIFEKDNNLYMLPAYASGNFNQNGDPLKGTIRSYNGEFSGYGLNFYVPGGVNDENLYKSYGKTERLDKNAVMIWENKMRMPFAMEAMWYAQKVADCLTTIDTDIMHLQAPIMIQTTEENVKSVNDLLEEIYNNKKRFFVISASRNVDDINITDHTAAAEYLKKAVEMKEWYDSQFNQRCNITDNSQVDKKGENLTTTEINVKDEYVEKHEENIIDYMNEQLNFAKEIFGEKYPELKQMEFVALKERGEDNVNDVSENNNKETKDI